MFLGSYYSSIYGYGYLILMDFVLSLMVFVLVFVLWMILIIFYVCNVTKYFKMSSVVLEVIFGVVPIIILLVQVLFTYDYMYLDGVLTNNQSVVGSGGKLIIKIFGHQWFWSYEYVGLGSWIKYDSYILGVNILGSGSLRLLEVDNRLVLPLFYFNQIMITSGDVIHSWFLPFYGFKLDALPGVVNTHLLRFDVVGVFYGMCSEVCGTGHRYIPIVVEVVPDNVFFSWLQDYKHKYDIVTRLGDWYKSHGVSSFF